VGEEDERMRRGRQREMDVGEKRREREGRGGRGREEEGEGGKREMMMTIQPCRRIHRRTHKYSKNSRAFTM